MNNVETDVDLQLYWNLAMFNTYVPRIFSSRKLINGAVISFKQYNKTSKASRATKLICCHIFTDKKNYR